VKAGRLLLNGYQKKGKLDAGIISHEIRIIAKIIR